MWKYFFSIPLIVLPWALESWAEYDIRVFGDDEVIVKYANKEHALVVLNHRGDLDWMIGWVVLNRLGLLGVSIIIISRDIPLLPLEFEFDI